MEPEVLQTYCRFVRTLARQLISDEHAAEDIAQKTLLSLIERPPRDTHHLLPWLRRVVWNLSRNEIRRRRRYRKRLLRIEPSFRTRPDAPPEFAENGKTVKEVVDAVLRLKEPYRTAIILRYYENLAPGEIATQLKIPPETVRTHLHRAIGTLRKRLDQRYGEEREAWRGALLPLLFASDARPPEPPKALVSTSLLTRSERPSITVSLPVVTWISVVAVGVMLLAVLSRGDSRPPVERATVPRNAPFAASKVQASQGTSAQVGTEDAMTAHPASSESIDNEISPPGSIETGSLKVRVKWPNRRPARGIHFAVSRLNVPASAAEPDPYWGHSLLVTDAAGEALLEDYPAGEVFLHVDRMSYRVSAKVVAGELYTAEFRLTPGVTVEGNVVDGVGDPVEDAEIILQMDPGFTPFGVTVARSDHEGKFWIRDLSRRVHLGARARGYAPSRMIECHWGAFTDQSITPTLVLSEQGGAIEGSVTGPDARPIAGARLIVGLREGEDLIYDGRFLKLGPPLRATTDHAGLFRVEGAWLGSALEILVRAHGYAPCRLNYTVPDPGPQDLQIKLENTAALVGRVKRPDGTIPSNTSIYVRDEAVGHFRPPPSALVGPDGTYRLDGLCPGPWRIGAQDSDSFEEDSLHITTAPGEVVQWNPTLASGRTISGRVVDEEDRPLAHWTVVATAPWGGTEGLARHRARFLGRAETKTDEQGVFRLTNRLALPHRLEVFSKQGWGSLRPAAVRNGILPGEELFVRVPDSSRPTCLISGSVDVEKGGSPPPIRMILVPNEVAPAENAAAFSLDPEFEVGPFPPGRYWIKLNLGQWPNGSEKSLELGDHELKANVDLDLGRISVPRTGRLRARVFHQAGQPFIRPGLVVIRSWNELAIPCVFDGEFLVCEPLFPGRYRLLVAGHEDSRVGLEAIPFEIQPDQTTELAVSLRPAAVVLFVLDEPGDRQTVRFFRVYISDARGKLCRRMNITRTGRLAFVSCLSPGRYRIAVLTDNGLQADVKITVLPGQTPNEPVNIRLRRPR